MKKLKFLPIILAVVSMFAFSSCNKLTQETYWQSMGTLVTVTSPTSIVFEDDKGVLIKLTESPFVMSTEYEGKRASVTFIRTDEVQAETDKVMNGKLVMMTFIETATPTSLNQYQDEETIKKELGQQYITPTQAWFAGGYLNLVYKAGFSNLNEKRKVSLAIDTEKTTETEIYASLYYKADDAPNDYHYNNFAEGLIAFNMKNFVYGDKVVALTISYKDAEMRGDDVLVIKSDNSLTKSLSSVNLEQMRLSQQK